jgi:hypothetical protein
MSLVRLKKLKKLQPGDRRESDLKSKGGEIEPGNIFFAGWDIDRGTDAVECVKCGGFCESAESTPEEITSELNCGSSSACCCVAFKCKRCGARMVGAQDAPEMA